MNAHVVGQLHPFCDRVKVPRETSMELVSFLTVKTILGQKRAGGMSPSSKVDKLLHAVLLDTEVRKSVEELVGEIHHREVTAELPDELKKERRQVQEPCCKVLFRFKMIEGSKAEIGVNGIRRLAAMNAMSKEGFEPKVTLWEEPGTLMHSIVSEYLMDLETGKQSTVYSSCAPKEGPGLRRVGFTKGSKRHDGQVCIFG